ncbi:MAG: HAMP domain-containing sensor histidine kinase [Myxococcota bacterium]|nr:HAMP domain-containing sensor histidine kinase [Myxococcota bacterium]
MAGPRLGVSGRVLASAVLSALVGTLLVALTLTASQQLMRDSMIRGMSSHADLGACEAAPEHWGANMSGFQVFAYDAQGNSRNPQAPPLEPSLLLAELDGELVALPDQGDQRERFGVRVRSDGPCAILRLTLTPPHAREELDPRTVLIGVATILAMTLVGLASWGLVVRPMQRRIEGIADSAGSVGHQDFEPPPPQQEDDLGTIARVLGESHQRIQTDRQELIARHKALEKHLAGIAHDLRTPLASMQLSLEALLEDGHDAQGALSDMVYLSSLVENLHQGVRLRHGLSAVDGQVELGELVERLGRRFSLIGKHSGIEVAVNTPERPVPVLCAPALAERALANLVQNAVAHNRPGGHVAVLLDLHGDRFELRVLDDGPGLPADVMASLELPTFSEDQARQRGPGLGLLITREIAHRAGWEIAWEPQEDGLCVRIEGALAPPA